MILHISKPYLWLPVKKSEPKVKLHFYLDGEKIREIDIRLGNADRDFYTCMDMGGYLGRDIEISGNVPEDKLSVIFCSEEKVRNEYAFRPQLHFTPEIGWSNDPNGLIYADGVYHLYYQWNPYDVEWGNMHWGHAVSRDLLRWEHRPMALAPDEYGTMFSGCGWEDRENAAGYGKNALLFFYTAAGGTNEWSVKAGNLFTQRLTVSTDGGTVLQKAEETVISHIAGDNRDPKVFYHEESGAYVMVLFLEQCEFAIFRSKDLLHWEETQRISGKGMWECPDLFALSPVNAEDEKKWIFWAAGGYYMVGTFDGYRFIPESDVLAAYSTGLPYAAQTYSGVSGRVVSVAWLRMANDRGNYRGLMSVPAELSLVKKKDGYGLRMQPVRELREMRKAAGHSGSGMEPLQIQMDGIATEVVISWEGQTEGTSKLHIGDTEVSVDFGRGMIMFCNPEIYEDAVSVAFDGAEALTLDFIIDQEAIEFYGNDGLVYGAVEAEEDVLHKAVIVAPAEGCRVEWYELKGEA